MRTIALLCLAFALLALPTAAAQDFAMSVTITGAPEEMPTIRSNDTATSTFRVEVHMTGAVCANGGAIPVTLDVLAGGAPAFATITAEPADLSIAVPQGAYLGDPGPAFSGGADAAVVVTATEVTDNATVPITISATAQPPAECQNQGLSAVTSEPVVINAPFLAPEAEPEPEPEPEKRGLPGPGLPITLGVLGALALRHARRD